MKIIQKLLFLFNILLLGQQVSMAQELPPTVCKINKGQLVFTIDLNWNENQKQELRYSYSLDSLLIAKIYEGQKEIYIDSNLWIVEDINDHLISLTKSIEKSIITKNFLSKLIAEAINGGKPAKSSNPYSSVKFGTNSLKKKAITISPDKKVVFFFRNNKNAQSVFLSGTFNNWSTGQTPMQKTDSGWVYETYLEPGKYLYKYIVDGNWKLDPNNELREPNEHGTDNSVFFVYNYKFELNDFGDAKEIILSGSFNYWNKQDHKMHKTTTGWELPVFLKEGTHFYRYIVDGRWVIDPTNSNKTPNEFGEHNSVLGFGEAHSFELKGFLNAKKVYLAGNFNDWKYDELLMKKTEDGWRYPYHLAPGNYEYKFIVDGRWITDPSNPLQTGSGDFSNSFFTFKPNYVFELNNFLDAKQVIITGSFNNWSHSDYRMTKMGGKWVFPIHLNKGKHLYKFIMDGKWIVDPANKLYEENEYDTGNSVIWVE